jgi:CHASE2 domain-containing sensor protein
LRRLLAGRWGRFVTVALVAALLAFGLQRAGLLDAAEHGLYDALVRRVLHRAEK